MYYPSIQENMLEVVHAQQDQMLRKTEKDVHFKRGLNLTLRKSMLTLAKIGLKNGESGNQTTTGCSVNENITWKMTEINNS